MDELLESVSGFTRMHDEWRRECINLIASENVMSPRAEELYVNDMMHRYAEGLPFKRYYQGHKYLDQMEAKTQEMFCRLFGAGRTDLRPLSGTIANLAVFVAMLREGDVVASLGVPHGAHVSHTIHGALGLKNVEVVELPFDNQELNVDVERATRLIEQKRPRLVILGASLFLFPHPVRELADATRSAGGMLVYDAAHVLGLVAGGEFQDPFREGADIVTSSTHKTFPGPQGGVVMATDSVDFRAIEQAIFPRLVCNHHIHRIPALAQTAWEMWKYGRDYARQTIRNARVLAGELASLGFRVLGEDKNYTESHQVVLDVREYGGGRKIAELLEGNNIIANKNMIPGDETSPETMKNPSGIRIGTQEMTRWGCKEDDMREIARLIRDAINGENVKQRVIEFRKRFQEVQYC